ncbi:hypothetical protein [Nonomuraea sp. NPDC049504]
MLRFEGGADVTPPEGVRYATDATLTGGPIRKRGDVEVILTFPHPEAW